MSFSQRILRLSSRRLWLFSMVFSIITTELLVCGMEFLLKGQITYDYPLTGFIASLCVSGLVVSAFHLFIKEQNRMVQRLQAFSHQVKAQSDELFEKNWQILRHEQQRQKSEQRLNALFENMSNGVAIYEASADGQEFFFTGFNRAAERIEAMSREQVLGKNVKSVFPAVETFGLLAVFRRVWASGLNEHFPLAFYDDGRVTGWRENYVYKLPTGEIVAIYEDITQRKQTEEALQRSEAQFRAMIEASPVPYALNNAEQQVILLNSAFINTFGYTLSDIPTLSEWWPRAYPDPTYRQWVKDTWQAHLNKAWQQGIAFEPLELVICCKNGSHKTVMVSAADLGKSFAGTHLVILYDISDRKQAEQALHLLNKELLHYFEQPLLGMITAKPDKSIIHVNQRFCDMLGYSTTEMQILDWSKITHPDDIAESRYYWTKTINGEIDSFELEKRYIHKDGHLIDGHVAVNCVRNDQGQVEYLIAMILDITQRKRNEERLRQSENRFRELFANTPVAYQALDNKGCFLDVNNPLCQLLGYTREQLIGHSFGLFWSQQTRDKFEKNFTYFMLKGQTYGELELVRADGEIITVLLEGRVQYDTQGEFVCTHCVLINISERKRMENALNQSNTDLEQFAYSVSHDMRQPLRSISSHLQLLQRAITNDLSAENNENLAFALEGARRMDAMIKSLLEYSRIGRKTDNKTWLASRDTLNEAIDFLKIALEESKIILQITGDWPTIFASHDELVRLFLNLLNNAIKYREPQHSPLIEITAAIIANNWQVAVRDFGIGIDQQQIGRLFQFFSRLQARQRFEGTGMGLALCKRIVEHHQGNIWVESTGEGYGSCFIFSLPLLLDNIDKISLTS